MMINEYQIRPDGIIQVQLTQGQVALVDSEDWERLKHRRWYAAWDNSKFYARSRAWKSEDANRRTINMHREILKAETNQPIDHINHIGTDNRRSNIRLCSVRQNSYHRRKRKHTTSNYKGVHRPSGSAKWVAQIVINKRKIILGYFDDEIEAAQTYDAAAQQAFGEFAHTNGI